MPGINKVLYSCLSRSWGGMEMYAVLSSKKLIERGIETHLVCYPGSKIEEAALKENIEVVPVRAEGYFHPKSIYRLSRKIKQGGYDLVHTQASKDLWTIVPALNMSRSDIPLFITKQVGSFIEKNDMLHKKIYNRVTRAFAISMVIKKNLVDTTPLSEDKIRLLHNGVDTKRFDPAKARRDAVRKEFGIKTGEVVTGMLARFSWGKGHEEFLHAAKIISGKFPEARFMIVGEPSRGEDEYAKKIYDLSDSYGLKNKVIFTGFRSDTPDVLSAMDIFAFPSHSEAFGIALVEAMAAGKPSVVSDSDGVLDIALDGKTSYLFKTKDGDDLADKLEKLVASPELRENFGAAAIERARNNFDIEIVTDRVLDYYREALEENR